MTIGTVAWRISNSLLQRTKISTSGRYQEGILLGFHQPGWVWRVSGNYKYDFHVAPGHCSLCPFVECWLFKWSLFVWHSKPETKLEGASQPALLPDQVRLHLARGHGPMPSHLLIGRSVTSSWSGHTEPRLPEADGPVLLLHSTLLMGRPRSSESRAKNRLGRPDWDLGPLVPQSAHLPLWVVHPRRGPRKYWRRVWTVLFSVQI